MNKNKLVVLGGLSACLLLVNISYAGNSRPDAGRILREMEQGREHQLPKAEPELRSEEAPSKQDAETSETILVNAFNIVGNTQLSQIEIDTALAPYTGKKMNVGGLHDAADALTKAYHTKGYFTAMVFLPPHTIKDGLVTLHVVEGHLDENGVEIHNPDGRVETEILKSMAAKNLQSGTVLTNGKIERTLLLIDDLPGLSAKGTLYPGAADGSGRLRIETTKAPLFSGNVGYDTLGSHSTGEERGIANISINSPTSHGEQLNFSFITTGEKSNYGFGELTVPIGYSGLRAGGSFSYLKYKLTGPQFKSTKSEGSSKEFRTHLEYPIIRSRKQNLYALIEYARTELEDESLGATTSERDLDVWTLRLYGNSLDNRLGGGSTSYNASTTFGNVDLDGFKPNKVTDSLTAKTDGSFARFNAGISRLQRIKGNWSTLLALSGQLASGNLDTSQQFSLGGAFSVPGYPVGEAYGDEGALAQADLRYDFSSVPWHGAFQVAATYSAGWIKLHDDQWNGWEAGNPVVKNEFTLQSIGLGVSQIWKNKAMIRANVAWQLGSNRNRNPVTGDDNDFSDRNYRVWIQSVFYF